MPDTANALAPQSLNATTAESSMFRLIADSVPALIAYFEVGTLVCRFANQGYASYNGHTTQSILGKTVKEAIGDAAWEAIRPHVDRCLRGEHVKYVREQTLPSGARRMIEVNLIPHFNEARTQLGSFVLISDITHHWLAERLVRESEERMRKFAAATEEAIVFHQGGTIIDGNDALQRLSGYPLAQILGRSTQEFLAPRYRALSAAYLLRGDEYLYEAALVHRDGHEVPVEIVGKNMPQQGASYRIAVLRDISVRKTAQQREAFIALHDTLTQLPNRRHLMEQLQSTVEQAQRTHSQVAVLFIDLDHFKTVNDSLGHQAGDQLLCEMARRLRAAVRPQDMVARLGGDKFVAVLATLQDAAQAAAMAEALRQAVCEPTTLNDTLLSLSPSIGISLYPGDSTDTAELLRHADAAMYHAKASGRGNCQFYAPTMAGRATEVLQHERLLRDAIAQQAFVLHYQPQVRLDDGALVGLEALVRWQHPERGLVGPDEFIGLAESRGLITPIGRWVLHAACHQLKAWQAQGLALVPVAVNLSALEFRQRDVVAEIAAVLQATGLEPRFLDIELTESVLMHHSQQGLDTLKALKALGVGLAIDDFGTGYSSLAYLKRYPIDKLKIDRSFVMDTPGSADDVAIVTAIVQMGRSLQLQTVAEGVETEAQLALLRQLGCDMVQGHAIARPMDAAGTGAWLQAR
ncbi:GGDEF domain-containing protein [Acidovorax sp. SRB_14]|nr:GGDEF domain-containing protein [Acidovorax sp. SRB_14]